MGAILIIDGRKSIDEMKAELRRFADMVNDNCKKDLTNCVIINKFDDSTDEILSLDIKMVYCSEIGLENVQFFELNITGAD